jgi:hypothetical protein
MGHKIAPLSLPNPAEMRPCLLGFAATIKFAIWTPQNFLGEHNSMAQSRQRVVVDDDDDDGDDDEFRLLFWAPLVQQYIGQSFEGKSEETVLLRIMQVWML